MALLYKCVLLKLSGELFMGKSGCVDARAIDALAGDIAAVVKRRVRVGAVVGGGNIMRGRTIKGEREDERAGHKAGMVATVVNGILLTRALIRWGVQAQMLGAFEIPGFVEADDPSRLARLRRTRIVSLFVGGTGVPFKSTDSATVMKAVAIGADAIFKVTTQVDAVYDRDPKKVRGAKRLRTVTYDEALRRKLGIMDLSAFAQAREHGIPIHVFKGGRGNIMKVLEGRKIGSLVADAS